MTLYVATSRAREFLHLMVSDPEGRNEIWDLLPPKDEWSNYFDLGEELIVQSRKLRKWRLMSGFFKGKRLVGYWKKLKKKWMISNGLKKIDLGVHPGKLFNYFLDESIKKHEGSKKEQLILVKELIKKIMPNTKDDSENNLFKKLKEWENSH